MTLLETIRKDAKTSKWVGILLLVSGLLALVMPLGAGPSLTVMIGVLLLMSGGAQLALVLLKPQPAARATRSSSSFPGDSDGWRR